MELTKRPGRAMNKIERLRRMPGVQELATGAAAGKRAHPVVFLADASLLGDPGHPLEEELFGPATVLVALDDQQELLAVLRKLHGCLTASLFAASGELAGSRPLIDALDLLTRYADSDASYYDADETVPIAGVVPAAWRAGPAVGGDRIWRNF